jgi:hypothetical protein
MFVFLDFEASSLGKRSYPIEVAWVFEDGERESHLIRPAPGWTDWDETSEAIHHISRPMLAAEGRPHDEVAQRMIDRLGGHDLFASAPSWDGKWLSTLLRAAGRPRHALRLRNTDEAHRECATAILSEVVPPAGLSVAVADLLALVELRQRRGAPLHRALADAEDEWAHWCAARAAAKEQAALLHNS